MAEREHEYKVTTYARDRDPSTELVILLNPRKYMKQEESNHIVFMYFFISKIFFFLQTSVKSKIREI